MSAGIIGFLVGAPIWGSFGAILMGLVAAGNGRMPETVSDPKRGHWICEENDDYAGGGCWRCSECGYGFSWAAYNTIDEQDYCPHCGVRMEESSE